MNLPPGGCWFLLLAEISGGSDRGGGAGGSYSTTPVLNTCTVYTFTIFKVKLILFCSHFFQCALTSSISTQI